MIKNEFLKFFGLKNYFIYTISISIIMILFTFNIYSDTNNHSINQSFNIITSEIFYYVIPLVSIFLIQNIFNYDIYSGKLKFFICHHNQRKKILVCKIISILFMIFTLLLSIKIVGLCCIALIYGNYEYFVLINYISQIKDVFKVLFCMLPIIMILISIAISIENFMISGISLYFFCMSIENIIPNFQKYIPTGIIKIYLSKSDINIVLILIYIIICFFINCVILQGKDFTY